MLVVVGTPVPTLSVAAGVVTVRLIVSTLVTATPFVPAVVKLVSRPSVANVAFNVSAPRPPSIAAPAPTRAVEAAEVMVSSLAVVNLLDVAFDEAVLTTGIVAAARETLLPVPWEPNCRSAAASAVTPVSVITVSVATATPLVAATT